MPVLHSDETLLPRSRVARSQALTQLQARPVCRSRRKQAIALIWRSPEGGESGSLRCLGRMDEQARGGMQLLEKQHSSKAATNQQPNWATSVRFADRVRTSANVVACLRTLSQFRRDPDL